MGVAQRAGLQPESITTQDVLQLQRAYGNRAVSRYLGEIHGTGNARTGTTDTQTDPLPSRQSGNGRTGSGFHDQSIRSESASEVHAALSSGPSKGGLRPGVSPEDENQLVGGRTFGEWLGDVGRVVGTSVGNVVGSVAGALTGISISSTTNSGPTWGNHGHFDWRVGFSTTGRNGWLVQEIVNTMRAQDNAGNDLGGAMPTPRYWEAWAVDGTGNVTPNVGPNNDYWIRPSRGNNTQGHWSMKGKAHFTTTDPTTQGFTPGGVADAGILLSTTTAPSGLGVARLHRYAQGTWDSTGAAPTHTGSAT